MRIYCNLSNINIRYYIKLRIPMYHPQFFGRISQNRDYIETFECRQWYLHNNPQCNMV